MNMDLKFIEHANSMDKSNKEMRVLVYKKESDDLTCPNCGIKIKLNTEKLDEIILSNKNIQDIINGIKFNIKNIIKLSTNNSINIQLKNINVLFNNINEDINKNVEKLKTLLNESINILENKFKNIKLNDKINKEELKYNDGRYIGEVVNGKKEGKGIYYYNDGDRYEGDWKNDIREGKGIYYYNDGERYEGDWKNGKKEGKGIYYYNSGNRYEGDWKNDNKEGKGICYYKNGNRY